MFDFALKGVREVLRVYIKTPTPYVPLSLSKGCPLFLSTGEGDGNETRGYPQPLEGALSPLDFPFR